MCVVFPLVMLSDDRHQKFEHSLLLGTSDVTSEVYSELHWWSIEV